MPAIDPQTRVGDLCNEIHPIFRRQSFQNISDFEYEALKPALQFASLLLTTPELAGFPHAILVAPYKHVPHPDDEALDQWAFQEKGSKLSTRDMAMYNLALNTLADMVVFVASSKTADKTDGKAEDLHIHYGETRAKRLISSQNTHLWHCSTIRFSREDVDAHTQSDFCNLYQSDHGIKRRTFETAKILLHELMHAMSHARLGWLDSIPLGSNKAVETGYEWENHVFGGVICNSNLAQSELRNDVSLMIGDWPAPSITRTYQRLGYPIDVLEEPSSIEMRWWILLVESEWFDKLSTTEFWEKTVPELGMNALRAPRRRGYRVKIAEDGSPTFFDSNSEDASLYGCTIPAEYVEDFDGEIVLEA